LAHTNKTKHNYKLHKNLNNHAQKLLTDVQTEANETKGFLCRQPGNGSGLLYSSWEPHSSEMQSKLYIWRSVAFPARGRSRCHHQFKLVKKIWTSLHHH